MDYSVEDLSYAAATIDCEGTISIHMKKSSGGSSPHFFVMVWAYNTDLVLIKWLLDTFGGSIYTTSPKLVQHKPSYRWYIASGVACDFIRLVLPYLKLKREQAEIALELEWRMGSRGDGRLLDSEIDARLALKEAMHILNRRGQ